MNNGVAACGFTFDPTDYYRQAVMNMDGRPRLTFTGCRCALLRPAQSDFASQKRPSSERLRRSADPIDLSFSRC